MLGDVRKINVEVCEPAGINVKIQSCNVSPRSARLFEPLQLQ